MTAVRSAGGVFIADEVQPGFGRTCHMWGFGRHGITPDIVTMGKPMGNGYPMSGMAASQVLLAKFCEDFGYFSTFGGTAASAAAGLAVLDAIRDEGLQENAANIGAYLAARLQAIAEADERVSEVRCAGLFIGIELCRDGSPLEPDPGLADQLVNSLCERRVLIRSARPYGHTLKIRPPLCLTREDADFFADALTETLRMA